jgi:microcystin-dependent protein
MDEIIKVSELQTAHEITGDETFIINQTDKITKTKKVTMKAILDFMQSSIDGVIDKYVPPGSIYAYAGKINKIDQLKGWLLCNGSRVSKQKYGVLYSKIKDIYTPVNVSVTKDFFYLPNLIGRSIMGFCDRNAYTPSTGTIEKWIGDPITLGQKVGFYSIKLSMEQMTAHVHSDDGHTHQYFDYFKIFTEGPNQTGHRQAGKKHFEALENQKKSFNAIIDHKQGRVPDDMYFSNTRPVNIKLTSTGGSLFHNNMQPSIALNYIIKI